MLIGYARVPTTGQNLDSQQERIGCGKNFGDKLTICRRKFLAGAVGGSLVLSTACPIRAAPKGQFKGDVIAKWEKNGREMTLTRPFKYISPNNQVWSVPAGTTVDGASIPRFFWSIIGGPFEGRYRNASVVHDFYCKVRTRRDIDVHRMFYEAMQTSGVAQSKSWLMYQAVKRFGPQWKLEKINPKCLVVNENYDFEACARNSLPPKFEQTKITRQDMEEFLAKVEAKSDPSDIATLQAKISTLQ